MTPNLLPPPEIATAHPPAWATAGSLCIAVLVAAFLTLGSLPALFT